MMRKLEIACFSLESALIAAKAGANRIELCANANVGGITPDLRLFEITRKQITIDLNVMIRPRGGTFVYSETEFKQMKSEITAFKKAGADGFVFGILNSEGEVDIQKNQQLIQLADPFPCTFHRAFDSVPNYFQSLADAIYCGFQTILTSGSVTNVVDGMDVLSTLVQKAENRIVIMPGGGLRSSNLSSVLKTTHANWYHSSAITDGSETANPDEIRALQKLLA